MTTATHRVGQLSDLPLLHASRMCRVPLKSRAHFAFDSIPQIEPWPTSKTGLNVPAKGSLGPAFSWVHWLHRLDPGIIPFRKATQCQIHVSGGEFNVAANLADCFRMKTGIATRHGRLPASAI